MSCLEVIPGNAYMIDTCPWRKSTRDLSIVSSSKKSLVVDRNLRRGVATPAEILEQSKKAIPGQSELKQIFRTLPGHR